MLEKVTFDWFPQAVTRDYGLPDELAAPVNAAPPGTHLYRRQPFGEISGIYELRRDGQVPFPVHKAAFFANPHRGQAAAEAQARLFRTKENRPKIGRRNHDFPVPVDKSNLFITYFAATSNTYGCELFKLVELDRPDIGEWIEREWLTIPPEYFKKGDRGLRNALVNNLYEVNFLLSQGWSHFTTDFFCYPVRSQRVQLIGNR